MSRAERGEGTLGRFATRKVRAQIASERDEQAERRDETARARDLAAEERDRTAEERDRDVEELEKELGTEPRVTAALEAARREAAIARARAAADRERAAQDREAAASDREGLLHEAERSHFDELTGAYRREVGEFVLGHEIESARRSDRDLRFACLVVEGLGETNRREGQAAGDALLCDVFATLRVNLRPFDPIVRWHGGEFVCAISGADLPEVRGRLDAAVTAVAKARPGASIRVGLVELREDDTVATAVDRADQAARTPDFESGA
jgi:diguanylate cyclase (GGDEF)-like protein